jgi:hypothetical protein
MLRGDKFLNTCNEGNQKILNTCNEVNQKIKISNQKQGLLKDFRNNKPLTEKINTFFKQDERNKLPNETLKKLLNVFQLATKYSYIDNQSATKMISQLLENKPDLQIKALEILNDIQKNRKNQSANIIII